MTIMTTSAKGRDLIKHFEGVRLHAYKCPAGIWTVGYGHTGSDVTAATVIDEAKADRLLIADLARFEAAVRKMAPICTQGQFDALVAFAFNIGEGALAGSTLLKLHNAGNHAGAAAQFARWNKGGGRVLPGLVKRRAAEADLYLA